MNKKFFLLIFAFVSCTNSEKPAHEKIDFPRTVNLNLSEAIEDSMNLSEIAYKVEYIPLQTTDSSLMGYFWNYAITKDYFFIVNELSVLTFDKYGKYINSLFRVGSGTGSYE
jgi:6-bladed beta-propeller